MPFLSVPGDDPVELHYEVAGSGRPVVLIHGWPLSARSWEPQVPALVDAGYRVVTYDRRGFGNSSQTWSGYDYDTLAADLDALLTEVDARDAVLVGFSMGGGEVARYLARYGTQRVSGAVFAAAVPPYLYQSADNPDGGLDDATIEQFESGVAGDRPAFLEGFTRDFMSAGDDVTASDATVRYLRTIAEFASPKATLDCIAAFGRTDFRDDLRAVTVPTLVVHGDSDAVVPFEVSGRRTHDAIPGSTLVVIEGGPHGINASHPDQFNQALLDFLATDRASSDDSTPADPGAVVPATVGRHEAPNDPTVTPADDDDSARRRPTPDAESTTADAVAADPATADEPRTGSAVESGAATATESDATSEPRTTTEPEDDNAPGAGAETDATAGQHDDTAPEAATEPDVTAEPDHTAAPEPATRPDATSGPSEGQPGPDQTTPRPTTSAETAGDGDDRLTGLTWRTAEADDPANQDADPTGEHARRTGWTADPNLGDVPLDRQPHPGL